MSPEEVAFQRQVHQHFGIEGLSTHPDYVEPDAPGVYVRDLRWSRTNADGSRLW